MKKRLDTSTMENELRQGSVFFQNPAQPPQDVEKHNTPSALPSFQSKNEPANERHQDRPKAQTQETERTSERFSVRKSERSEKHAELPPVSLPLRRGTKRYSFEFYVDQLERLRRIRTEEGLKGRPFNLSEIVRTALDEYLEKLGL